MAVLEKKSVWKDRIIEQRSIPLDELRANPANWRRHPARQGAALGQVLDEVGLVQGVILNQRSEAQGWPLGELPTLVDGHLRLELAHASGEASLPATVVDLSPAEERLVLATLDPLGALAEADAAALEALVAEVEVDGALGELLDALVSKADAPLNPLSEWDGMPEFGQEDQSSWKRLIVHFVCKDHLDEFAKLVGQPLGEKTVAIWYPRLEPKTTSDLEFKSK